jgi:beta-glucosidase
MAASMMDYDIRHGRTYMYFKGEALYPFGAGRLYHLPLRQLEAFWSCRRGTITVSVDVTNTGAEQMKSSSST